VKTPFDGFLVKGKKLLHRAPRDPHAAGDRIILTPGVKHWFQAG
jgi:hypothetical protein